MNRITEKMYDDMVQGANRLLLLRNYLAGKYGNDISGEVEADEDKFEQLYVEVLQHFKKNIESLPEDERNKLLSRYLAVYKMAMDGGNARDARATLDSMAKVQNMVGDKSITVKNDKENDVIEIKFGFD